MSRDVKADWRPFARAVRAKIESDIEREGALAAERRAGVLPKVARALIEARRAGLCGDAWLFGSYAWGAPGERSDVDLLVEEARDPDAIASVVGGACGLDVHVVERERAPASLVKRALAEGRRM
jgi:predicted nucleotidyltransferase